MSGIEKKMTGHNGKSNYLNHEFSGQPLRHIRQQVLERMTEEKAQYDELVQQAIELNPAHPRWYHGIIGLHNYLRGDYEDAVAAARLYFQHDVLLSQVLLTASLARAGHREEAIESARTMLEAFPNFAENGRADLENWRFAPELLDDLFDGLQSVGVSVQPTSSSAETAL